MFSKSLDIAAHKISRPIMPLSLCSMRVMSVACVFSFYTTMMSLQSVERSAAAMQTYIMHQQLISFTHMIRCKPHPDHIYTKKTDHALYDAH